MKRLIFISFFFVLSISYASAQRSNSFKFGILGGVSSYNVDPMTIIVKDKGGDDIGKLHYKDANYGMHFGVFVLAKSSFLFVKPQVQFNSQTINYNYDDLAGGDFKLIRETYQDIDIPIQLGINMGPLRLGVGPVGHIHLDGKSDFFNLKDIDYAQQFEEMTFGYILGAGIDIWNFHIDVGYEGNFAKMGDHIYLFGRQVAFDKSPARFIFTLGISF